MWYLMQARASPNVLDRKFRPVLHIATYMDDMCAAQMLLDHRADVNKVDFENRTAFDLATRFLRLAFDATFLDDQQHGKRHLSSSISSEFEKVG